MWQVPGFQIAKHALGKYIILIASLLHMGWATLVWFDRSAGDATAVRILFTLFHESQLLVIVALFLVALLACAFLNIRLRKVMGYQSLAMMLLPQQFVLWMSAGAGVRAAILQHYADGVERSFAHIAADQLPVVLLAVLYTIALIELRYPPAKAIVEIPVPVELKPISGPIEVKLVTGPLIEKGEVK